jgi:hypothetical protein
VRLTLAGAVTLGVTAGLLSCSTGGAAAPEGVRGTYDVTEPVSVGDLVEITFVDSQTYSSLTASDSDEQDAHQGTYVLDLNAGTLTLTDAVTGTPQVIPFVAGAVSSGPAVTTSEDPLHTLGGSLTGPSTGLSNGQAPLTVRPVCSFGSGSQSFQSSTNTACAADGGTALNSAPDGGVCLAGCCDLVFPSGVRIKSVANASVTASYAAHLTKPPFPLPTAPTCFIDMKNITDATTGAALTTSVKVSAHYTLADVVYGAAGNTTDQFVVVDPIAVGALEKFAVAAGGATVYSAFRGPAHQSTVCQGYCGAISCTDANGRTTCAKASQHMFGDAFDLTDPKFLTPHYQSVACTAGFKYAYNETVAGVRHLHMDTWGRGKAMCLKQTN